MTASPYLTPADMIAVGLNLPLPPTQPVPLSPGTRCAITGQPITSGYPVADMVTGATAEFLDCFRGGVDGYVSESAARCFKNADPRQGNPTARSMLLIHDGPAYLPLISAASAAEQGRPAWSLLVRQVCAEHLGKRCLVILTTDNKKRLWIRARVGQLGSHTPVLMYDAETAVNAVLFVDWSAMLVCLDLVEAIYTLGFPKAAIRESLYTTWNILLAVGMTRARELDRQLAYWRGKPEFAVATLIAQKSIEEKPNEQLSLC